MKKNGFVAYYEWADSTDMLTDAQAGELFRAVFRYASTGQEPDTKDAAVAMAFRFIRADIDRAQERYDEISQIRAEAGRRGGEANRSKRKQTEANGSKPKLQEQEQVQVQEQEQEGHPPYSPPLTGGGNGAPEDLFERLGVFSNVELKAEERRKLEEEFGRDALKAAVDDLSCKLADGSVQSFRHYATLYHWLTYRRKTDRPTAMPGTGIEQMSREDRVKALQDQWEHTDEAMRREYLNRYKCYPWEREEGGQ